MNFTLLVWEEVPELKSTRMFLIPNEVADKYRNWLEEAHGKLINSDESNDGMNFLNYAVSKEKWADGYPMEEHAGAFAEYEVKTGKPITETHITAVYSSGFYL